MSNHGANITELPKQSSPSWLALHPSAIVGLVNAAECADECSTISTMPAQEKATDGFAALADLDSNHDGVVNASDAAFSQLRVWRDADQDGVTDAGELQTLSSLGISGLNVASTSHSQTLANGNQIADLGTFIKADGQVGRAINDFIWKIPA